MPRRTTVRRWAAIVGMVTPQQLKALQSKVQTYHESLLVALTNLQTAWQAGPQPQGAPLPTTGKFTQATWDDMTQREEAFLAVSSNELNPLAWLDASSAYDQGRALITEMDAWRDELETLKAPGVPTTPLPVPASETSFLGDVGTGLMLVLAILAFREFGHR